MTIFEPSTYTGIGKYKPPVLKGIAEMHIMGRPFPVCADHGDWNAIAAEVFCKDAGNMVNKNWTYDSVCNNLSSHRHLLLWFTVCFLMLSSSSFLYVLII